MGTAAGILDSIKGSLSTIAIDIVVKILGGQINDDTLRADGIAHGKWLTANAKAKLGSSWEGIESLIQDKSALYLAGLNEGLNSDD